VSRRDEDRVWAIIEQFDDKDFTFTDTTSVAVMQRLRISAAFTFDADFAQYGLPMLTPELLEG
jgi:predicted nucleic acid-binding protein